LFLPNLYTEAEVCVCLDKVVLLLTPNLNHWNLNARKTVEQLMTSTDRGLKTTIKRLGSGKTPYM